jgi:hypothetical protein
VQVFFWSDIDRVIISAINPTLVWIVDYKFLVFLIFFSILLVTVQGTNLISYCALIAFYPLYLIFWRLPEIVWRQRSWIFAFAVLNTAISIFTRIKSNIIIFTTFLATTAVCVNSHDKTFAVTAMMVLLTLIIVLYYRAFVLVFQPSSVFQFYSGFVKRSPGWMNKVIQHQQTEFDLPAERQSGQQIQKQATTVQTLLLSNRLLLFFAKRLREYQLSQVSAISYTLNLLILMAATIIAFAATNMALRNSNPSEFVLTEPSSFFIFFYYSFNVFLYSSINEVVAAGFWSRIFSMSEKCAAILTVALLITLFFSIKKDKYKEDLDKTIRDTEGAGKELEAMIRDNYKLDIAQAMEEIKILKNNMLNIIVWLSKDI